MSGLIARPRRSPLHVAMLVLTLCLMVFAGSARDADARSRRGIAIGVGGVVGGLIILDRLSRSKKYRSRYREDRDYSERRSYRRKYSEDKAERRKKHSSKKRRKTDEDVDADTKAASKDEPETKSEPESAGKDDAAKERLDAEMQPTAGAAAAVVLISTEDQIKAAQEHLKFMGYDVPIATGKLDVATKTASMRFQESIGAETTGVLTEDQLQQLFLKANNK